MSFEYTVHVDWALNHYSPSILEKLGSLLPNARLSDDGSSLLITSDHSNWIDFSIEKSEDGFWVVCNANGTAREHFLSLTGKVLDDLDIKHSIDEA
ncbi:hypothetical protein [Pseudomonas purpurea]|uniref:hypothetical protein n=1 Tax=Pseudomonas purpurea TaxID=3136737 RepID=UPI003262FA02